MYSNLSLYLIDENVISRQEDPIVVILHSMITHEEQARAMKIPPADKRMIILATNIAESSITVPDVKYGRHSIGSLDTDQSC